MPNRLCEHCTATCCRYIALPLDTPVSAEDFDDIRWYLAHENVTVFVEKGDWYISFATPCRYLNRDFRCGIYKKRPRICRGYRTGACDYHGGEYRYDLLFCEPAEIERYAAERLGRMKKGRSGKRKE
jgi:Fe-S-cluster containining protein